MYIPGFPLRRHLSPIRRTNPPKQKSYGGTDTLVNQGVIVIPLGGSKEKLISKLPFILSSMRLAFTKLGHTLFDRDMIRQQRKKVVSFE